MLAREVYGAREYALHDASTPQIRRAHINISETAAQKVRDCIAQVLIDNNEEDLCRRSDIGPQAIFTAFFEAYEFMSTIALQHRASGTANDNELSDRDVETYACICELAQAYTRELLAYRARYLGPLSDPQILTTTTALFPLGNIDSLPLPEKIIPSHARAQVRELLGRAGNSAEPEPSSPANSPDIVLTPMPVIEKTDASPCAVWIDRIKQVYRERPEWMSHKGVTIDLLYRRAVAEKAEQAKTAAVHGEKRWVKLALTLAMQLGQIQYKGLKLARGKMKPATEILGRQDAIFGLILEEIHTFRVILNTLVREPLVATDEEEIITTLFYHFSAKSLQAQLGDLSTIEKQPISFFRDNTAKPENFVAAVLALPKNKRVIATAVESDIPRVPPTPAQSPVPQDTPTPGAAKANPPNSPQPDIITLGPIESAPIQLIKPLRQLLQDGYLKATATMLPEEQTSQVGALIDDKYPDMHGEATSELKLLLNNLVALFVTLLKRARKMNKQPDEMEDISWTEHDFTVETLLPHFLGEIDSYIAQIKELITAHKFSEVSDADLVAFIVRTLPFISPQEFAETLAEMTSYNSITTIFDRIEDSLAQRIMTIRVPNGPIAVDTSAPRKGRSELTTEPIDDPAASELKTLEAEAASLDAVSDTEITAALPRGSANLEEMTLRVIFDHHRNTHAENEAAAIAYTQYGSLRAYNSLVLGNMRWVVSIANRYRQAVNDRIGFMDIIGAGKLGLIRAAKRFDPQRGYRFSTYATWWIKQSINRMLDDCGKVVRIPVHANDWASKIRKRIALLATQGNENPLATIAEEQKMTIEEIETILLETSSISASLDAPVSTTSDKSVRTLGDILPDEAVDIDGAVADHDSAKNLILLIQTSGLTEQEQDIMLRRFGLPPYKKDQTLEEIGNEPTYQLTRERIRQLEKAALAKMRAVANQREEFADEARQRTLRPKGQTRKKTEKAA